MSASSVMLPAACLPMNSRCGRAYLAVAVVWRISCAFILVIYVEVQYKYSCVCINEYMFPSHVNVGFCCRL